MTTPILDQLARTDQPTVLLTAERSGIPIAAVEALKLTYSLTDKELLTLLRMNVRTLQRRRKLKQPLDAHESAAFVTVGRLLAYGAEVFGDTDKLVRWLRHSNGALMGERPLDLIASSTGSKLVENTLTRIEYGVYS